LSTIAEEANYYVLHRLVGLYALHIHHILGHLFSKYESTHSKSHKTKRATLPKGPHTKRATYQKSHMPKEPHQKEP